MSKIPVMKNLEKVVVNSGIGRLSQSANFEDKVLPELMKDFAMITGQKPSTRSARKSISGFKLREGSVIGLTSTLRGRRMTDFLEKLNKVVFPRVRDFHGISPHNVDKGGNLNFGISDHLVFPEVSGESSKVNFGIQVTLVPKMIKNREEAILWYREMGMPLQKSDASHPKFEKRPKKSRTS